MRNEVGARRSPKAIQANPMATAEDIAWLREQDPVAAVQHPNCPFETWWELAKEYPLEAMSSTLYWMLTLEDPARWEQLQRENIGNWITRTANRLFFRERELFTADCAEHVLSIYEQAHPNDTRVRDTIKSRRRYANRQLPQSEWERTRQHTQILGYCANTAAAANSAFSAAAQSVESALGSVFFAVVYSSDDADKYAEKVWQWERVQQYAKGEVE